MKIVKFRNTRNYFFIYFFLTLYSAYIRADENNLCIMSECKMKMSTHKNKFLVDTEDNILKIILDDDNWLECNINNVEVLNFACKSTEKFLT